MKIQRQSILSITSKLRGVALDLIDAIISKDEDLKKIIRLVDQGVNSGAYHKFPKKQHLEYIQHLKSVIKKQNEGKESSEYIISFKIRGVMIGFAYVISVKNIIENGIPTVEIKQFSILEKYQSKGHSKIALSMLMDTFGMYNIKAICFRSSRIMMHILEKEGFREFFMAPSGTRTFLRIAG